MARLDQLALAKEVAQTSAVIGREFSYEVLAEVSTLTDDALNEALEWLCRSELIFRRGVPPHARYIFKHALVQDAAYESLLKSRRQKLHASIAQVIESQFPERTEIEPELLAHHYTEAGLSEQAVKYWRRAGDRAVAQSAHLEAIGHLNRGLTVLEEFPEGPEHTHHELNIQSTLGPQLIATKGYGASVVIEAYTRAKELWRKVGETAQLCPILYGLWTFYTTRAEYQTSKALCGELLNAAESAHDPAFLLDAHVALSCTSQYMGQFDLARGHSKRGMALYDPQRHRSHALQNPGVVCRTVNATALWYLGYPEQAMVRFRETLSLARELSHPFSLVVALTWFAMLLHHRRDALEARALAEEAVAISSEQSFPFWEAVAAMVRGWALVEQGQQEKGRKKMSECAALVKATGARIWGPYRLSLLAEAYEKAGQASETQKMLAEALIVAGKTGEQYWEAEIHRLQGELQLRSSANDTNEAEVCFQQALEVARRQGARSLELRASISLSRLWHAHGKSTKAKELLAPIYGWFTEGFDTADLMEAKALLEEMS